jgi:hypothetical protein
MSEAAEAQEPQGSSKQEGLFPLPISRVSYTVKSQEQTTGLELKPGQFIRGTFQGRVAGLHYDEAASKKDGDIVPDWRQKFIVVALDVTLDGEE